jgi:transposase
LVLCVDEKSQIQALDRTQPLLPMQLNLPERRTHDYVRHGTTSLFAALEVTSGKVHGRCYAQHTHVEFIAFLDSIRREYPRREIHLICDNYGTHKHPKVKQWLATHPRFQIHFTPTSASWLNLVERWFGLITSQAIRRGSFDSVRKLEVVILRYLAAWNEDAKPFRWTTTAREIRGKIRRALQTSEMSPYRSEKARSPGSLRILQIRIRSVSDVGSSRTTSMGCSIRSTNSAFSRECCFR